VSAQRARQTNEERSAQTRARVLDAALDCLIEMGYSSTTTTLVSERAGVSRGAQLHHFPTKAELLAAAVEHLANRLGEELLERAAALPPDGDRVAAAIDLLWSRFATPLFPAWLELWVAARTDPELAASLQPLEDRVKHGLARQTQLMLGSVESSSVDHAVAAQLTLYLMQGLMLSRVLGHENPKSRARREAAAIEAWKRMLPGVLTAGRVSA